MNLMGDQQIAAKVLAKPSAWQLVSVIRFGSTARTLCFSKNRILLVPYLKGENNALPVMNIFRSRY